MDFLFPVLIGVLILLAGVFAIMTLMSRTKDDKKSTGNRDKSFKDAEKRLEQDPKNIEALKIVGEIYFREESWDLSYKTYSLLMEQDVRGENEFDIAFRYGMSAMNLGLADEAYRGFTAARNLKQDNFEVNYNLGALEFERKNYEKAAQLLQQARIQDPDNPAVRDGSCLSLSGQARLWNRLHDGYNYEGDGNNIQNQACFRNNRARSFPFH